MTLYDFPTVLYDQIFETLIKAARAGYSVPEKLLNYVLHTYIWERALRSDDVTQLKTKLIRPREDMFLIGHGLSRVTSGIFDEEDAPSPIDLIVYWPPMQWLRPYRTTRRRVKLGVPGEPNHPDLNLRLMTSDSGDLLVENLTKYLQKGPSGITTNIACLRDEEWKIHTVEVQRKKEGTDSPQYMYEFEMRFGRQSGGRYEFGNHGERETIRLRQMSSRDHGESEQPP
ncbi:hypothetical protein NQ176_g3927 [Zarea fungicola]|uniref:Uncharacterized protein n=1 Tax=Zarea fungicola TaxID=93591 RepID=A0ACC1NH64_9HYPO|nr:hypothetical protein NQ176_g3927 [Lecanicillium fungicola]